MPTIVVVGAGPQLGLAVARRFAREGFAVALVARRLSQLQDMARRLREDGAVAEAFAADVTDPRGLVAALDAAQALLGDIEVLEYSPAPTLADLAAHPLVPAEHLTVEAARPELERYLFGAVTAIGHVLPGMLSRGRGTVLATSGAGSGPEVIPQVANANLATSALRNWLFALHRSVADRGVHVAHLALLAAIGQGRADSEPDVIAEQYWRMHTDRDEAEVVYRDMPEDWSFALAEKFVAEHDG